ncbi:MAG TPA: DNA primase [Gammaproteobacteria bacterium]|nr:DNA primase [Gammaproteobacteria bacterium]
MAGRIPQQFIDELMARVDIVELIDSRVPLKKAGREYTACCPFHSEKTPSFTVSPTKQFYHCFGCGAHGTALGFLMDYEHMDFVEAVEELARQTGMTVPRTGGEQPAANRRAPDLYAVLEQAAAFYRRQLRDPTAGEPAVAYLKNRGLTGQVAADFGIGYAPPGWDNLVRQLGSDAHSRELLVQAGLAASRESGGLYDRFRERVMFPIHDRRGRVIAFGGRVLGDGTPKYLNSPETPVFHKGRELYGLYEARKANRDLPRLLVVEGYMDVVALAQHGIRYGVATLGTATTREHLEQLFRVTAEVVFCFDGDRAGRAAAWRAMENALPLLSEGRQARFLFLPEGEDPDTLVRREGQAAFEARLAKALPLSDFFFEALAKQADTRSMDGHERLVALARPLLRQLPFGVLYQKMVERLGERIGLAPQQVDGLVRESGNAGGRIPTGRGPRQREMGLTPVRLAIGLLLHHPELAGQVERPRELEDIDAPGVTLLVELLEFLAANPHLNSAAVLEHWRGSDNGRHLARLLQWVPSVPEEGVAAEFLGALERLKQQKLDRRTEQLLEQARREGLTPAEKRELQRLLGSRHGAGQPDAAGKGPADGK